MANVKIRDNLFVYNAPAGSGKTTTIRNRINNILLKEKSSNILCITFTNRAVEELESSISEKQVTIKTIHSYIHSTIRPFFRNPSLIKYYLDTNKEQMEIDIENNGNVEKIKMRNERYEARYGELSYEYITENLYESGLYYNELKFAGLYNGGLSHDTLLSFTKDIFDEFPILYKSIIDTYDYIFIDEYQDTDQIILELFYKAATIEDKKSLRLYLYGDKMQEIFGEVEYEFQQNRMEEFQRSGNMVTNYRSSYKIIGVLNNLYNDKGYKQKARKDYIVDENKKDYDINPKIVFVESLNGDLGLKDEDYYKLYIFNKSRFKIIGSLNLYSSIDKIPMYSHSSKYSAADVLTKEGSDNPDKFVGELLDICRLFRDYDNKIYANILKKIEDKGYMQKEYFLNTSSDIARFKERMDYLSAEYNNLEVTIKEFLNKLKNESFLSNEGGSIFDDILIEDGEFYQEYETFLDVKLVECNKLINYLDEPFVSTQHGVKGEGHGKVIFYAEDSTSPNIKMYEFFKLLSFNDVNLTEFERFYKKYDIRIKELKMSYLEANPGAKSNWKPHTINKKGEYGKYKLLFDSWIDETGKLFSEDMYFQNIYGEVYEGFLTKPTQERLRELLNINKTKRILSSYKLFYVGCSRAKDELIVVVENAKISSFKDEFINKMKAIGFHVEEELKE